MSEAEDITRKGLGLPDVSVLLAQLAGFGEDEVGRRRRIHEVIGVLGGLPAVEQQIYRDAIVGADYVGKRDWGQSLSEAKKAHAAVQRDEAAAGGRYAAGEDGYLYLHDDRGPLLIARFVPRVVADIIRDDGAERIQVLRIRVTLPNGRTGEVDVTPERLRDARVWALQAAGAGAVVMAISRAPEHVLAAAQILGDEHERHVVFTHTGWRHIGGQARFLTASGALGATDLDDSITVDLGSENLNMFSLPDPGAVPIVKLRDAVRASLNLAAIVDHSVSVPHLAAAYRAPLPLLPDCAVWALGLTGVGKSTYAALIQQHYGAQMDAKHLPGNWTSTGNSLEATAFSLANVLFVVDDYNPQGAERDQSAMKQAAERLIRGSANAAGRGRQRRDGTPAPQRFPRAQVLATGEDVPPGHSLRARLIVSESEKELITAIEASGAQQLAADGVFALAMAGYVRWLAQQYDELPDFQRDLQGRLAASRSELAKEGRHRRIAEGAASLLLGWEQWLRYAVSIGAIKQAQGSAHYQAAKKALTDLGDEQGAHQRAADPVRIWCKALAAAVTGGTAHLAHATTGLNPDRPERWGWRQFALGDTADWRPNGHCVGWIDGDNVYLDGDVAHEVGRDHAARQGTPVGFTSSGIRKRLKAGGILASFDKDRLTKQAMILGKRKNVLHVHWEALCED